jgi:hypothetical protein
MEVICSSETSVDTFNGLHGVISHLHDIVAVQRCIGVDRFAYRAQTAFITLVLPCTNGRVTCI